MSFEQFKLNKQLFNAIDDLGWKIPTDIQKEAIPLALNGADIIGVAQTGTGKTAAYLLPILYQLKYAQLDSPRCLIIVPTKELAVQVEEQAKALCAYTDLRVLGVYGGVGITQQLKDIENGLDIIVATPKRFFEAYKRGALILKKIKFLVLDEADRLMQMGFLPQLHQILEVIPNKRKNYLFSATFNDKVQEVAFEFLENPTKIEITPTKKAADTVEQTFLRIPNFRTKVELVKHFVQHCDTQVIVFTRTKEMATNLFKFLDRKLEGGSGVIHSNKSQNARINTINRFKEKEIKTIVATDVSSRGIDVPGVGLVINFEVPSRGEDYIHRIGRTGRANQQGKAITLANKAEMYFLNEIIFENDLNISEDYIPEDVMTFETPKAEVIANERVIDAFKQKKDPNYKGAFHDKKKKEEKKKFERTKSGKIRGSWRK